MTAGYRTWSGQARAMALALDDAVSAAQARDADGFAGALSGLGRVDGEQVAVLLGAVLRELLERAHPDGLDSDDAEAVLRSCTTSAGAWYGPVDGDALLRALTAALGIADPADGPPLAGPTVIAHGLLLIADQLATMQEPLAPTLDGALRELMRAQTVELP